MNDDTRHLDMPQEEDDVPWKRVLLGFGAMLAIAIAMTVAAVASFKAIEAEIRRSGVSPEERLGPRRSINEVQQDLFGTQAGFGQRLDEEKRRALSTYGWVDRDRRIVRIPIDEAMDILAEENR